MSYSKPPRDGNETAIWSPLPKYSHGDVSETIIWSPPQKKIKKMPPQFTPELQVTCLNIPYKQVFFLLNEKQMAFLQNELSYDASDVELEKWTLNIPYKHGWK